MLLPDQVLPFLVHEKPFVRAQAIEYFQDASCIGTLTADHFWQAIDHFGPDKSLRFLARLWELPQTEASYARTMEMLAGNSEARVREHLQRAIAEMDLEMLRAHRDELLDCPHLNPEIRDHLRQRLELMDSPPAALWQRLMDFGREVVDAHVGDFDERIADRLIEALARDPAAVAAPAMDMLNQAGAMDNWRGIFAVRFLGAARCEQAADRLIDILTIDTDVLRESVNEALARFGSASVAEKLAAFYPGKPWHVRLYAHVPLENLKHPESEAALLSCLEYEDRAPCEEEGDPLDAFLLGGLCRLGSMAGYERARKLIELDPRDPEIKGLRESQLAVAIMTGTDIPESGRWMRPVEREHARIEDLLRLDDFPSSSAPAYDDDSWDPLAEFEDDDDVDLMGPYPSRTGGPQGTYRRSEPKVGRNDPCPCGSGKKYKKCCWAKE